MADLFTLVGTIALDCDAAEKTIDRLLTKTKMLQERVEGTGGVSNSGSSVATTTTAKPGGSSAPAEDPFDTGMNVSVVGSGFSVKNFIKSNMAWKALEWVGKNVKTAVTTGIKEAENYETNVMAIQTMTGKSYEESKAFYDRMLKLDEETPLNDKAISTGLSTLYIQGRYQEEQILPLLKVLGDAARGDNDTFVSIADIIAKALSGGKADAKDINRMADAKIPIFELLGEVYGMTGTDAENTAAMREMMEKGQISGYDLIDALTLYTQPGHSAYNAMANAMQTKAGIDEQTEAMSKKAARKIAEETGAFNLMKNLSKTTGAFMQGVTEWLDGNSESVFSDGFFESLSELLEPFSNKLRPAFDALTIDGPYNKNPSMLQKMYDAMTIDEPLDWKPTNRMEALLNFFATGDPRYMDSTPEVAGPPLPPGWTPASNTQNTGAAISEIKSIVASIPGAIESGLSNTTITVDVSAGNVRLDTGAMVGVFAPQVSVALGGMAALHGRGLAE